VAKVRIYELARDLGVESKEALQAAQELGFEVKTASSGLEPAEVDKVRARLSAPSVAPAVPEAAPPAEPVPVAEPPAKPEAAAPIVAPEPVAEERPVPVADEADEAVELLAAVGEAADQAEAMQMQIETGISPQELGDLIDRPGTDIVADLIQMGEIIGLNSPIPDEALELLGESLGYEFEIVVPEPSSAVREKRSFDDKADDLVPRPPVVTVMGHVDHGKTTLLDYIRSASVVTDEFGGITQHIGAYQVVKGDSKITFLDTPGHEAFTALRARGAELTDIVVLVVAADDGIMPQTQEAISHAKAAGVPIIVAINKMDRPGADPASVRAQLTEYELVAEQLGGEVPTVELSALTGEGVDELLEVIDLVAQVEDFKGNPKPKAAGTIVESQLDVGRGPVATVIVQRGTLKQGDALVAGPVSGRVRAMLDHSGERVTSAGPSAPVLIMGWSDVPTAGDPFDVLRNEREARNLASAYAEKLKEAGQVIPTARERLAQLLEQLRTADDAELRLIVKADAHGSLEAIRESIAKITREGGTISIVHGSVGGITENDVSLAEVTEAVVFGFNVRPDPPARRAAEAKGIEIRTYQIIYEMLDDIEAMLVGRLAPDEVEAILGSAEVREVFKVPRRGNIAGSYVTEGTIVRGAKIRLLRAGVVIHTGSVGSLRRFKDDVREVHSGFECGIALEGYNDVKEGDVIEAFEVREVARD